MLFPDTDSIRYQENYLVRKASETQRYHDLLYFHAVRREHPKIEALEGVIEDATDRLAFDLLTMPAPLGDAEVNRVIQRLSESGNLWLFATFAKCLLSRNEVQHTLALVFAGLKRWPTDTSIMNLMTTHLVHEGNFGLAAELVAQALKLSPDQADIEVLLHCLEGRDPYSIDQLEAVIAPELYLEVLPAAFGISYYIPMFNAERFIRGAIEGLLHQSYPINEIIVVDDGSQDRSVEIAREYPVTLVEHGENKGLGAARNTGVHRAASVLIGSIDADVIPEADYLRHAMLAFENPPPRLAGVGGRLIEKFLDSPGDLWRARHLTQDLGELRRYMPLFLPGGNTLYRKDRLDAVGGYDERRRTNGEDSALCRALREAGDAFVFTPLARSFHQRRDTLDSAFRTYWRYDYWPSQEAGAYGSIEGCAKQLEKTVRIALSFFEADAELRGGALLYASFLYFYYMALSDLAQCAEEGLFPAQSTRAMQEACLDMAGYLDQRFDPALHDGNAGREPFGEKVRADTVHLLIGTEYRAEHLPREILPVLESIAKTVHAHYGTIAEEAYRQCVAAPTGKGGGQAHFESKEGFR